MLKRSQMIGAQPTLLLECLRIVPVARLAAPARSRPAVVASMCRRLLRFAAHHAAEDRRFSTKCRSCCASDRNHERFFLPRLSGRA